MSVALGFPCSSLARSHLSLRVLSRRRYDVAVHERLFAGLPTQFGAFLPDVSSFDASAFGLPAPEADLLDPQQRLLLECASEVLMSPRPQLASPPPVVGVSVGISSMDYNKAVLAYGAGAAMAPFSSTGASLSVAAGRIAFTWDLKGPAVAIDTGEEARPCRCATRASDGVPHVLRCPDCRAPQRAPRPWWPRTTPAPGCSRASAPLRSSAAAT